MHIDGTYTLQATPDEVWRCLMQQQVLAQVIPGVEQITQVAEHQYELSVQLNHSPLVGSYQSKITLSDSRYPSSCHLLLEGQSWQGDGYIYLHQRDGKTVVSYNATLTWQNEGTTPQTVTRGAAKLLMQQFFHNLATQLREQHGEVSLVAQAQRVNGNILILPPELKHEKRRVPTVSQLVVRLLRLGKGDHVQEDIWEERVRRGLLVAGFLFLVWIGTRLPRRKQVATS